MEVPSAKVQSELAPLVKSVVRVEESAGSEGQVSVTRVRIDILNLARGRRTIKRVTISEGLSVDQASSEEDTPSGKN